MKNATIIASLLLASSALAEDAVIRNEFEPGKEASSKLAVLIDVCKGQVQNSKSLILSSFNDEGRLSFCTCAEDAILAGRAHDHFDEVGDYCRKLAQQGARFDNQYRVEGQLSALDIYNQMELMRNKLKGSVEDVEAFASCLVDSMRAVNSTKKINIVTCSQRLPEVFERIKIKGK